MQAKNPVIIHGSATPPKQTKKQIALERLRKRHREAAENLAMAEEAAAIEELARVDALGAADFVACIRAISPDALDSIAIHIVGAASDLRQQESTQKWIDKVIAQARKSAHEHRTTENSDSSIEAPKNDSSGSVEVPKDNSTENKEANSQLAQLPTGDEPAEVVDVDGALNTVHESASPTTGTHLTNTESVEVRAASS